MKTLKDLKQALMQDPNFVREYEALEPEYRNARQRQRAVIGAGHIGRLLTEAETRMLIFEALARSDLDGQRVLVVIPDHTRTAPLPLFFRLFHEALGGRVAALDYLVALGTHQPLSDEALNRLVGITAEERRTTYAGVSLFNHRWDLPGTLTTVGTIPAAEISQLSNGMLVQDLPVTLNRMVFDYDQLVVCGPVFPHEVVGFSGGNKYFFPGISGPEVIDLTHWLGALLTSYDVIGSGYTPVRAVIDQAASFIPAPRLCFALVVGAGAHGHAPLQGLFIGSMEEAWQAAADLSSQVHIVWLDRPYRRVLSVMPEMYDDLWTAAKGMYKLEPAIADGGEVVIYAPHIDEISHTHGQVIDEVGYHVRDYFVEQWERFKEYPWGVLAHSTHLRGIGAYDAATGLERPRIRVTLATGIPRERCERVNLGYLDPQTIDISEWENREDEGLLVVPKAGEMLYRVKRET